MWGKLGGIHKSGLLKIFVSRIWAVPQFAAVFAAETSQHGFVRMICTSWLACGPPGVIMFLGAQPITLTPQASYAAAVA